MANRYTIKKYDGDDQYSWAVFLAEEVKGMRSPIFWGQATPLVCGLSRKSATYERDRLEKKESK